jgi:hypothetical protein
MGGPRERGASGDRIHQAVCGGQRIGSSDVPGVGNRQSRGFRSDQQTDCGMLYLSHRTVSGHLHRAFPKLGVATRAALRDALENVPRKQLPRN